MKYGTTRVTFFLFSYAIKLPRLNRWKSFLRGILANLDERMWYKHSPAGWRKLMCPSLFTVAGFILIAKRAEPLTESEYKFFVCVTDFKPIPMDNKITNFGWYDGRIVLIDYADSKYFCSDCEITFKTFYGKR